MTWPGWQSYMPASGEKPKARGNKYHAQLVTLDGQNFDSKKEARRYQQLKSMELSGQITGLELQPRYALTTHCYLGRSEVVGEYVADFRYLDLRPGVDPEVTIEDVKSAATKTALYQWKKKHVELEYGITIVEV